MPSAVKNRLIISGLVVTPMIIGAWSVAWLHRTLETYLDMRTWAHMTIEASLNLLWLLLAFGAFIRLIKVGERKAQHFPTAFISLLFALALLFPAISANDDLLQQELINDCATSQAIVSNLKTKWQLLPAASLPGFSTAQAVAHFPPVVVGFECVDDIAPVPHDAPAIRASGNHSPPYC